MKRTLPALFVLTLACSSVNTPAAGSRDEIIRYVRRAGDIVRARGGDACAELQRPSWFANDWYIFVLDAEGRTVCHPARPEMIGTHAHELVDAAGKRFGDEFMQAAARGGGWVDYLWPRPNASTPEPKRSYVFPVTSTDGKTYIVGSGGHTVR